MQLITVDDLHEKLTNLLLTGIPDWILLAKFIEVMELTGNASEAKFLIYLFAVLSVIAARALDLTDDAVLFSAIATEPVDLKETLMSF